MTALFSSTVFLSAALLFLVQPMFARMILPLLGGAPAVWNTSVVFYQSALFAGYLYAYLTTRHLAQRTQLLVHLLLLLAAMSLLPLAVGGGASPPATANPTGWVFRLLLLTVGLPFFALAATGPLLQQWFAVLNVSASGNPYSLYAASNLGSFLALLAYPFVIEPRMLLRTQSAWWAVGYGALVTLIGLCALATSKSAAAARIHSAATSGTANNGWVSRRRWLGLALLPCSLMLSVTTFISTDIAAVPLIWIVPLGIYLLTLVVAFADRQVIPPGVLDVIVAPTVIGIIALVVADDAMPAKYEIAAHLGGFTVLALACHVRLAAERPHASRLTEFYVWIAGGGALGGLFNAIAAPQLFSTPLEYPLAAIAACLLLLGGRRVPATFRARGVALATTVLPAVLLIVLALAVRRLQWHLPDSSTLRYALVGGPALVACYALRATPWRMAVALVALVVAGALYRDRDTLHVERTFFGVYRVQEDGTDRILVSGTTNHGAQSIDPRFACEPFTYYSRKGPIGQAFDHFAGEPARTRFGVVGLGTATLAAYAKPGQTWTFFEIDPAVERLARNPAYFTYLRDCAPGAKVALGDARLLLGRVPDASYDVLLLDAFSSDAIPVHLLTLEAMELYFRKLSPGGMLVAHVSNRHFNLEVVLAAAVRSLGLAGVVQAHKPTEAERRGAEVVPSRWVLVSRSRDALPEGDGRWLPLEEGGDRAVWTDDFVNLWGTLWRWTAQ